MEVHRWIEEGAAVLRRCRGNGITDHVFRLRVEEVLGSAAVFVEDWVHRGSVGSWRLLGHEREHVGKLAARVERMGCLACE